MDVESLLFDVALEVVRIGVTLLLVCLVRKWFWTVE